MEAVFLTFKSFLQLIQHCRLGRIVLGFFLRDIPVRSVWPPHIRKAGSVEIHLFVTFPHVIADGTVQPLKTASFHSDPPVTFNCPFSYNENRKYKSGPLFSALSV